ncbi:MAG: c-type cytochrome [Chloroherpetonaceae bacterium]|nr:c-type cytochrome [Chloroherpetonaceae bacterium]
MIKKIILGIFAFFIALLAGAFVFFQSTFPKVAPPESITVEATPERLARGKYLAHSVAVCIDCHSTRDWQYFSGPPKPGTFGQGGELFGEEMGFPGSIYARNITPAALSSWRDGELIRAIRNGVDKHGHGLFPIMPYPNYQSLSKEDVYSIVAYIRTLAPVTYTPPKTKLNFPLNFIVETMPSDHDYGVMPEHSDTVAYGKYLFTVAGCSDCHTPNKKHDGPPEKDMERYLAGGFEFPVPWGMLRSTNITPDKETGIGLWTREQFVGKFKTYAPEEKKRMESKPPFDETRYNSIMPWTMYADMTEEDLSAIYAYLQTVKPIHQKVKRYSAEGMVISQAK